MDAASLAVAVFNEVFNIFFGELESKFTYQHTILHTFGKRFIHGKIIYKLEDVWIHQISQILQQLKKAVIAYQSIAEKYNERYKKTKTDTTWWWSRGKVNREDLGREIASTETPPTAPKNRRGFRINFSQKRSQLEWALFDRQNLEIIVNNHTTWTERLVEIMKLTLLLHCSTDIVQVEDLSMDAQTFGFSSLTNKRLLILDPNREGQATILDARTITMHNVQPPAKFYSTQPMESGLTSATVDGSDCLIEYKRYLKDSTEMDLGVTQERIIFLSKLLSVGGEGENLTNDSMASLHCLGYFHEPEKSRFGLAFHVPQDCDRIAITLNSGITTLKTDARPTLGQRFDMAYTIGYAIMEWFLVDWVHKGISSNNIYLFRKSGQEQWDFSSAYLGGFEYARPAKDKSNEASNPADFHTNL
ncbi:hypothetical protein RUND412_006503 [Rhizina undulata]